MERTLEKLATLSRKPWATSLPSHQEEGCLSFLDDCSCLFSWWCHQKWAWTFWTYCNYMVSPTIQFPSLSKVASFFWPGWRKQVSTFVSECPGCLHRELIDLKDCSSPAENRATRVNQTLCMDLVGPLPLSNNKNKYILTMFDHFSRFVVTAPIPDKSARTVCSNIYAGWKAKFGCPDAIRMDAGT